MRILIAEDDRPSLQILQRRVEQLGHDVVPASDGQQAWVILCGDAGIEAVITDWMMPQVDGLELCRRIRQMQREIYLPVLMLTARSDKSDLADGIEAGADAFLTKPLNIPELKAQLKLAERIVTLEKQLRAKRK